MMLYDSLITPEAESILQTVTKNYLGSGDFNGTPMRIIDADDDTKRGLAEGLVNRGLIALNFGDRHENPYVQALPPEDTAVQLRKLRAATDFTHICM
jgi:hypothetical protein